MSGHRRLRLAGPCVILIVVRVNLSIVDASRHGACADGSDVLGERIVIHKALMRSQTPLRDAAARRTSHNPQPTTERKFYDAIVITLYMQVHSVTYLNL